jgi:arylsulfatase A-like enzyme
MKHSSKRREFLKQLAVGGLSVTAFNRLAAGKASTAPLSAGAGAAGRPNILYVLTDQWSPYALGYAGDPNVRTPNLDALARESLNLPNATSVCPVCTPARASLMTGRYPTSTGMFLNDLHLPLDEQCLAESFAEAGYATGYIGKWHLDGLGRHAFVPPEHRQGFQFWKAAECDHNYPRSHYYANESEEKRFWDGYDAYDQTRAAQAYLRERAKAPGQPFFFMISYGGPHFPHETAPKDLQAHYPPGELQLRPNVPPRMQGPARRELQGYYAHCEAIDACVGELRQTLAENGLAENTLIVFTSDHGEMMGSQGVRPKQKQVPWNESAGVPFLIHGPGIPKGQSTDFPLNTPDLFPTLAGLADVPVPDSVEGEDHSAILRGAKPDPDHAALYMAVAPFMPRPFRREYRALRTARYTYVRAIEGPWLLYDNEQDPYQMNNRVNDPAHAALLAGLDARLDARLRAIGDDFRPAAEYNAAFGYETTPGGFIPTGAQVENPQAPNGRLPARSPSS